MESKGIISFNMQQPPAKPLAKRRLESSSDRSDDEASEGSSGDAWEFSSFEEDDEDSAGLLDAQESNDEDSGGSSKSDDEDSDWTDGPSPLTMNGIVAVHCHRLTLPTGPETGKTLAELLATLPHNQSGSMLDPIVID